MDFVASARLDLSQELLHLDPRRALGELGQRLLLAVGVLELVVGRDEAGRLPDVEHVDLLGVQLVAEVDGVLQGCLGAGRKVHGDQNVVDLHHGFTPSLPVYSCSLPWGRC